MLIKQRVFCLVFGILAGFISLYLAYAGLAFQLDPRVTQTSQVEFVMGYLLAASSFAASLLLVYAGGYTGKKKMPSA